MSSTTARPEGGAVRIVTGKARVTQTDGTQGRTLFPSPEFSHWPPFETLVESSMVGSGAPDPHSHEREEVANYVISGTLLVYDEDRRCTELPAGSVSLLSTVRRQSHDVNPQPGTTAHWIALVFRLPRGTAEPKLSYQSAPANSLAGLPPGVEGSSIVGEPGPVRSVLGLEMRAIHFREPHETEVPIGADRTAVVYVLDGVIRATSRELPAGSGLLVDGLSHLSVRGERGSRLMYASVLRGS